MIEITSANIEKAITKARQTKPLVKIIEFRLYSVTNKTTGATYEVKFSKINNRKFAQCDCKSGQQGKFLCYHVGAAIGVHIVLAEQMHTATA
jgi:hypothetical protein